MSNTPLAVSCAALLVVVGCGGGRSSSPDRTAGAQTQRVLISTLDGAAARGWPRAFTVRFSPYRCRASGTRLPLDRLTRADLAREGAMRFRCVVTRRLWPSPRDSMYFGYDRWSYALTVRPDGDWVATLTPLPIAAQGTPASCGGSLCYGGAGADPPYRMTGDRAGGRVTIGVRRTPS